MNSIITFFIVFLLVSSSYAQKDSLQLGDRYAEDQIYASITYAQFNRSTIKVTKSSFSYAISTGFLKDFILNKKGNISIALELAMDLIFLITN